MDMSHETTSHLRAPTPHGTSGAEGSRGRHGRGLRGGSLWVLAVGGLGGAAYLSLQSGVFTSPVAAQPDFAAAAAAARADGIIRVPSELPTLGAALEASQPLDMIELAPGDHLGGVTLPSHPVRVTGAGMGATRIQAAPGGPVLRVVGHGGGECSIEQLAIVGGKGPEGAGVLVEAGRVQLRQVSLRDHEGSAVVVRPASQVTLAECVLSGNHGPRVGGAVRNEGGEVLAVSCQFVDNTAITFGGAIYSDGGTLDLVACTFDDNATTSGAFGGAVYGAGARVRVVGSEFARNTSLESGGAVYLDRGSAEIERSSFTGNLAQQGAWAICSSGAQAELRSSQLCGEAEQLLGGDLVHGPSNSFNAACFADCNQNGMDDSLEIARGWAADVDANGVPDACDPDCNSNDLPDGWELAQGFAQDANSNGMIDTCEIRMGMAADEDHDLVPDEVQVERSMQAPTPAAAAALAELEREVPGLLEDMKKGAEPQPPESPRRRPPDFDRFRRTLR